LVVREALVVAADGLDRAAPERAVLRMVDVSRDAAEAIERAADAEARVLNEGDGALEAPLGLGRVAVAGEPRPAPLERGDGAAEEARRVFGVDVAAHDD